MTDRDVHFVSIRCSEPLSSNIYRYLNILIDLGLQHDSALLISLLLWFLFLLLRGLNLKFLSVNAELDKGQNCCLCYLRRNDGTGALDLKGGRFEAAIPQFSEVFSS